MGLQWELVSNADRANLAEILKKEREKQNTIDVVLDFKKQLHVASLELPGDVRALVNHKFERADPIWEKIFTNTESRMVTIGHFYDLITQYQLPFEGDWLGDCKKIYLDFKQEKVRIFVGTEPKEEIRALGSKYIITDGAHRAIVVLRRLDEGYAFVPIPVYTTDTP